MWTRSITRPTPNLDGLGDILHGLGAAVGENCVQLARYLVMHFAGNAQPARFGNLLQAGGDVNAVAKDIVAIDDDIAKVDPDPVFDALAAGPINFEFDGGGLHINGPADRIDNAGKFRQQTIAHQLHHAAVVSIYFRFDELAVLGLQAGMGAGLVRAHEFGIANDVR